MFEKEAEEYGNEYWNSLVDSDDIEMLQEAYKDGAEFGYNKANEDVKHDLMMKLKDEGIVKPLKDSIFRNERLSSQEQQELCAWIECAMDFGENLDECAKELEELHKANEWHEIESKVTPKREISKQYMPKNKEKVLLKYHFSGDDEVHISDGYYDAYDFEFHIANNPKYRIVCVIAWKEIVLPELKESE